MANPVTLYSERLATSITPLLLYGIPQYGLMHIYSCTLLLASHFQMNLTYIHMWSVDKYTYTYTHTHAHTHARTRTHTHAVISSPPFYSHASPPPTSMPPLPFIPLRPLPNISMPLSSPQTPSLSPLTYQSFEQVKNMPLSRGLQQAAFIIAIWPVVWAMSRMYG